MYSDQLIPDPIKQFKQWFDQAVENEENDPHAFSLATASLTGVPSVRVLLYKGMLQHENKPIFTFYSNSCSAKGQELVSNPRAEMLFYWPKTYCQVRIFGDVILLSREQSVAYFLSRSFASKLSCIASKQSEVIENREILTNRISELEAEYADKEPPCPDYWQGYGLLPERVEFWIGRDHRLHDRFCYTRDNMDHSHWSISRLSP